MIGRTSRSQTGRDALRRRALAYVADAFLVGGAAAIAAVRIAQSRIRRLALGVALGAVVGTLYHVLLEGWCGQTAGKRLLGVRVVGEDGAPCTYTAAAIRTAFRAVDALPAGYLAGAVAILLTDRHRRLGDLAAGTIVVPSERRGERD